MEKKKRDKNGTTSQAEVEKRDKNGTVISPRRYGKGDARYWRDRVRKRTALGTYQIKLRLEGHEVWIDTQCGNVTDAATKARDIFAFAKVNGMAAAVSEFKRGATNKGDILTLGDLVEAFEAIEVPIRSETLRLYIANYRKLVVALGMPKRMAEKFALSKYDYRTGGHEQWIEAAHSIPLSVLTLDAIAEWRKSLKPATAATIIRQAKCLFSEKVMPSDTTASAEARKAFLSRLPPGADLADIRVKSPRPVRHKTIPELDGVTLAKLARDELRESHPELWKAFILTYYGGLRRKEADCLPWTCVDRINSTIAITANPFFRPKTAAGERVVDVEADLIEELQRNRRLQDHFVLSGKADPLPLAKQYPNYYRAEMTWTALTAWLKGKGVTSNKGIHYLRKESGSTIASAFGIEAARHHLGHADISVTSAHYSDKKKRVTVSTGDAKSTQKPAATEGAA